jgi:glutamate:GABA antiporter
VYHIPSPPSPPSPGEWSQFSGMNKPDQTTRSAGHFARELPSGRLRPGWLPQVMTTRDMTVLCLFSVLLVSNVPLIAGAGAAGYLYWLLGFLTFLIPSALICAQLYRLFPGEGAVYLWANKAFGSFWDTFIGLFCNWFPGALGLTIEAGAVITYIQALNSNWLTLPWQQGIAEILVLVTAQCLCLFRQRLLQNILNVVFFAYSSCFILLGFAGLIWIGSGHAPQADFSAHAWQLGPTNWPFFALVIVSLLGMAVPLNMGAELVNQQVGRRYLTWGVIITVVGYLFATFGILTVLPPKDLLNPAFIAEVLTLAFGPIVGAFLGVMIQVILVIYFVCATAAFNTMFARLLVVAGVDRRLPLSIQRLNSRRVPFNATMLQTALNVVFVAVIFFLAPTFAPSNQSLSFVVFFITINGASVIWYIAMIGLFLCGILLCTRYSHRLVGKWIAPPAVLYITAVLGIASSGIAIYSTFFAGSPIPQVLNNADWVYYLLLVVLSSLAVGAAYSFLVPETEDLVALISAQKGVKPAPQPEAELAVRQSSFKEDQYAREQYNSNPGRTSNISGNVSAAQDPYISGKLFPGSTGDAGSRSPRNIPGRMG